MYAPSAILGAFRIVQASIPSAQLGGVVGDVRHTFGYHLARNLLPSGDYSVILPLDKLGDPSAASALDITLPADQMRAVTARLHDAALEHDGRLRALREFCGTLDSRHTFPWDLSDNASEGIDSWDSGHLSHVHLSGYRKFVDDTAAWADIAAVVIGAAAPPHPHPSKYLHRRWPAFMGPNDYFGLYTGPNESHGGYLPVERPSVRAIQHRLDRLGYMKAEPRDGIFGPRTQAAVVRWQKKNASGTTTRWGEVWRDDWTRLFTF